MLILILIKGQYLQNQVYRIYRIKFLALKKVWIVKITLP